MKDIGIKVLFVVILLFSLYLLITGIISPGDNNQNNTNTEVVEDIQLSTYSLNMNVGETYQVTAVVTPNNDNKDLIWVSGNPNVAVVNNGSVKAIGKGNTVIKVSSSKINTVKMINVNVNENVVNIEKINVLEPSIEIYVGDKKKIEYTIEPSNANNTKLSFVTSNKDIAGFDNVGDIVGVNKGDAVVTLTSNNNISATIKVTVKDRVVEVTGVKVNKSSVTLTVGSSETITATISPDNATNKTLTWSSSNNKVATVNNGKITGIKEGTTTIKVTTNNGKYKEISVTVKPKEVIYPALTDNSSYYSSFSTVDSYNSSTLKYRVLTKYGADFVLIWVRDPYNQWNSALPQLGKAFSAETLLNSEINKYGYQKKGLVATNASFFWDGWGDSPCQPFLLNKGKIIRDIENKKYPRVYNTVAMTKEGLLKRYVFNKNYSNNQMVKQQMLDDGVRNNFSFATMQIDTNGNVTSSTGKNNRTVLCQINKNNFVIYSGGSLKDNRIGSELKNSFGCKVAYNLDGGGSRKLYYKKNTSTITKRHGGTRQIPDMMYFVEQ